jgi:hypothetical protein
MHNMQNHRFLLGWNHVKPQFHRISLWFVSSTSLRCGIHNNQTKWPRNDLDSWGDFYIHMIYGLDDEFPLKRDGFPKVLLTCRRVYHIYTYIIIYIISNISYMSQALFTTLFIVPTMALWMHEKPPTWPTWCKPSPCRHWSSHGDQSIPMKIIENPD